MLSAASLQVEATADEALHLLSCRHFAHLSIPGSCAGSPALHRGGTSALQGTHKGTQGKAHTHKGTSALHREGTKKNGTSHLRQLAPGDPPKLGMQCCHESWMTTIMPAGITQAIFVTNLSVLFACVHVCSVVSLHKCSPHMVHT